MVKIFSTIVLSMLQFSMAFAIIEDFGGPSGGPSDINIGNLKDPLCGNQPNCDFGTIANGLIGFLITISIPLTAILVLVGGFQIMTAAGDPQKVSTGKKTILYAAIGFTVVWFSKGVVTLIQSLFGGV